MEKRSAGTFLDRLIPQRWRMRRDWDRRARENARHFIACGHSQTDAAFWSSGERELTELVLHDVALGPEARALEIGCGVGRLLRPLSLRIERVYGVDISTEMIERARRLLADRSNVELFATIGRLKPIPDASVDFVYSFIVFQHVSTKSAVSTYIRETARALKGRGIFRFQVDGRMGDPRRIPDTWLGVWYEPEELRSELDRNGFEVADLWGEGTHYLWVTAVRRAEAGRPESRAAKHSPRRWNLDALEALLRRLGCDPRSDLEAVVKGERSLRRLAERFLVDHASDEPEEFVRRAYEVLLGREADPGGLAFYAGEIAGGIPPSNTVDCLISSSELEDRLRPEVKGPTPAPGGKGSG